MPNHYTTIAICSPGHDFNCQEFNEKHKETCLCSVVMPMPEAVEQIPATLYPDGTTERSRRGYGLVRVGQRELGNEVGHLRHAGVRVGRGQFSNRHQVSVSLEATEDSPADHGVAEARRQV